MRLGLTEEGLIYIKNETEIILFGTASNTRKNFLEFSNPEFEVIKDLSDRAAFWDVPVILLQQDAEQMVSEVYIRE